ncbi:TetR family transcriptional regulator [Antricoccus suffuscus]|uniref:TetR family transcriptional regulator n=1 Tax=Antricoccus suffuscus TaxID=1629062 RepID=A0A2T0ZZC3_9ACTN|nr:TetR/AcrR family transcriptional regulator [Antricoccus suffuscus]PRZ41709.1 TetR family transcriptional regulator [Antricoccus suffuscus]
MTTPQQDRAIAKRALLIEGGAELIQTDGPSGFTARAVAAKAGVALSAVTYYFASVDDLLALSAAEVCRQWADAAQEAVRRTNRRGSSAAAAAITAALLPPGDTDDVLCRYEQLLAAARVAPVANALTGLRPALVSAIEQILTRCQVRTRLSADLILCVADGAIFGALSERRPDPRAVVRDRLTEAL